LSSEGATPSGAGPERPLLLRYFGTHLKSREQGLRLGRALASLSNLGWRTALVLSRAPEEPGWLEALAAAGARLEYLPRPRGNFDPLGILRAYRLCRRLRPGVLHCDNIHTAPLLGAALAGVPVRVWSKRSMEPHFEEQRPATLRERAALSVRISCRLATRTLAVSDAVRSQLIAMGLPGGSIQVLHNARRYTDGPALRQGLRAEARARFGYDEDALVIVAVGHAVEVKGWDVLLRAFGRLARGRAEARLLLVGSTSGEHERACHQALERLIAEQRLAGRVLFPGHLGEPAVAFAAGDVFVLPSRSEGYGNSLIEALSLGLPCVATRVGIAPEVVVDGVSGLLVERGDHEGLAAALGRLAGDPALREALGRRGHDELKAPTPDEHVRRLDAIIRSLLPLDRACAGAAA
jgi:glycosyltransferase involved in cell wall biosynthesis